MCVCELKDTILVSFFKYSKLKKKKNNNNNNNNNIKCNTLN
jgi:hypothetical protein